MRVLLLGVGMQGTAALHDLYQSREVAEIIAADLDIDALERHAAQRQYGERVKRRRFDAADPDGLRRLMEQRPDVVIDLLPHSLAAKVASAAVEHGVHLVNASRADAEFKAHAAAAEARGVALLPEFGLDPGLDLVFLGEAARSLDEIEAVAVYGAGVPAPADALNPIQYKVSWTFAGVLQTYRQPARLQREGRVVEIGGADIFAPENTHTVDLEGLGGFEAFPNGDALEYVEALEAKASKARNLGRYTLRWPGHCAFWRTLAGLHLLDEEPVILDGAPVDRLRFLEKAIGPHIQYGPSERDLAIVRVEVDGVKNGKACRTVIQVVDARDLETGFTAMSRTVGFTASIGAQMVAAGKIARRGLLSPAKDVPFGPLVEELGRRGVRISVTADG